MASQMDALQSFVHLKDNVPSWLSKLDDLTVSVAEHNARFIEMARLGDKLLKRKNPSTESLRGGAVQPSAVEGDTTATPTDVYVPPNPSHQCLSHSARARFTTNNVALVRKRKGSNSSLISEHPRYRTRTMVVVYYDSAVQEAFESLFRSVASARSNLRKGKLATIFKSRMASLGTSGCSSPAPEEHAVLSPKMLKVGLGRRTLGLDSGANDNVASFEEADNDLEITQNLCEVAAHQFLRDGDCRLEIEGMRKKLENCRAIAEREVEKLKEEERQEQEELNAVVEPAQGKQMSVTENVEAKVNPPPPLKEINITGTGMIEIDDRSDAESVQLDLSAFKTRTMRARRV